MPRRVLTRKVRRYIRYEPIREAEKAKQLEEAENKQMLVQQLETLRKETENEEVLKTLADFAVRHFALEDGDGAVSIEQLVSCLPRVSQTMSANTDDTGYGHCVRHIWCSCIVFERRVWLYLDYQGGSCSQCDHDESLENASAEDLNEDLRNKILDAVLFRTEDELNDWLRHHNDHHPLDHVDVYRLEQLADVEAKEIDEKSDEAKNRDEKSDEAKNRDEKSDEAKNREAGVGYQKYLLQFPGTKPPSHLTDDQLSLLVEVDRLEQLTDAEAKEIDEKSDEAKKREAGVGYQKYLWQFGGTRPPLHLTDDQLSTLVDEDEAFELQVTDDQLSTLVDEDEAFERGCY